MSAVNQYLTTFYVNLLSFGYGLSTGWTSAAIPILQSNETNPLPIAITDSEASVIGSILTVGGFFGTIAFGFLMNVIGRKWTLFLIAFPQIFGWIAMYLATSSTLLIVFRFLAGFAAGGIFTVMPIFITEISEDNLRGRLGSTIWLFFGKGLLCSYIFGAILPYYAVPWISIPFSLIFLLTFYHAPETPLYLIKIQANDRAEMSLRYYRDIKSPADPKIESEMKSLASTGTDGGGSGSDSSAYKSGLSCADFQSKHARKSLALGLFLMALNQFCGVFAMLNFTSTIFEKAGSTLSANVSSIIVGGIQIVGALVCTLLVEKFGRKSLLSLSAFGTFIGLASLSLFIYLSSLGYNLDDFKFLPLILFGFFIFISNLGILTLPFLYVSEIVPMKIKGFTMILCLAILYIFATIVIQFLSTLIDSLGMHGTMLFFGINSLIGAIVIQFCLPETKGKSYDEIVKILS